jgi:hypothetical protein
MDMIKFGHHANDQTDTTPTPDGVIKIRDIGQQMGLNLWIFVNSQGAGLTNY